MIRFEQLHKTLICALGIEKVIRNKNVVIGIAGVGSVGSYTLEALASLGFTKFNIADSDIIEKHNIPRVIFANKNNIYKVKDEEAVNFVKNKYVDIDIRSYGSITENNINSFVEHSDIIVDTIDFFNIYIKELLYNTAKKYKKFVVTAAPLGYEVCKIIYDPYGIDFYRYNMLHIANSEKEKVLLLALGFDQSLSFINDLKNLNSKDTSSCAIQTTCSIAGNIIANEILKLLYYIEHVKFAPIVEIFNIKEFKVKSVVNNKIKRRIKFEIFRRKYV